jgi:hypothetical protein
MLLMTTGSGTVQNYHPQLQRARTRSTRITERYGKTRWILSTGNVGHGYTLQKVRCRTVEYEGKYSKTWNNGTLAYGIFSRHCDEGKSLSLGGLEQSNICS